MYTLTIYSPQRREMHKNVPTYELSIYDYIESANLVVTVIPHRTRKVSSVLPGFLPIFLVHFLTLHSPVDVDHLATFATAWPGRQDFASTEHPYDHRTKERLEGMHLGSKWVYMSHFVSILVAHHIPYCRCHPNLDDCLEEIRLFQFPELLSVEESPEVTIRVLE